MNSKLVLLQETIKEMILTRNNKLLIERFSFEERIDVFSRYIEEIEDVLNEFDYNMEYQNLLFTSVFTKEVKFFR